ncbi:ABC transporter permease [Paenibacillus sp. FSL H8-0317]|uniref:ABC transporter permease n=1 Tax=Paenibacillus TaxID=44249 RepID=UPI001C8E0740|nr:ABC transporter permease [Paenibacillus xylanexedens]MBY0118867.1 ABC transporter permease [Paenibacillus xylanexedens]
MNIWHICIFELKRILKIRSVVLNLFILPLLLIFILGTALSSTMGTAADVIPDTVRVGIIHLSTESGGGSSTLNQALDTFVKSPEVAEMIKVQNFTTEEEAVHSLRTGKLDFAVMIPSDFEQNVMMGKEARLQWIRGKDNTLNTLGETLFTRFTDEWNRQMAITKVLGPEVTAAMTSGLESNGANSTSITVINPGKTGTSYSASQYYAASMLAMFMLYSGMTTSTSLFGERDNRTLIRLQAAPIGNGVIFAGKIAGNSLLAFLQATTIILMTYWFYGVDWGTYPGYIVLTCVLITLASMTLGIIVSLVCKSTASAGATLQGIIIVMTFISGGFRPIPVDLVQRLSEFTVNHWALQSFLRMMLDAPVGEIVYNILMLGVVCAVLLAISGLIYRKAGYRYE